MRLRWLLGVVLCAHGAQARPAPAPVDDSSFWVRTFDPHGAEIDRIVASARRLLEPGTTRGLARVRDAYGRLRYARRLAPENTEVLGLLGEAADLLGKTGEAVEILEACVRLRGADHAAVEVTGRLGAIALRRGKLDDAIGWLRHAQGPIVITEHAVAAVHLATALAARGAMADAIDALTGVLPAHPSSESDPVTLVHLALAVHYDRDEQPGATFTAVDRMRAGLQHDLGPAALRALALMPFAPAEEEYYYRGLVYELTGSYAEARAEWLLYAAFLDAPWRARALAHVAAIDAERRSSPPHPAVPPP